MGKNETQAVWNDRNEQINFAMHMKDLLLKEFGGIINSKYQGAGKIACLVITGHDVNPKKMDDIRRFLTNNYGFNLHRIKGHSHIAGTIIVHISEISEKTRKKVEDDFKKIIIDPIVSTKQATIKTTERQQEVVSTTEEKVDVPVSQVNEESEETTIVEANPIKTITPTMQERFSVIKKGRALISAFLTTIFRFEGSMTSDKKDKVFSFNKEKNDDIQIISFKDEADTEIAFKGLTWHYGSLASKGVEKEGNEVWANFFTLDVVKKRPIYINFTLPPLKGENIEQIAKRVTHVLTGYKTSKLEIVDEFSFEVAYARAATTSKFFELIVEMGWNAELVNDVVVCQFRQDVKINDEASVSETHAIPSEESPKDEIKSISIKDLFSQAEAILKIKEIYAEDSRWSPIPPEKKEKIIGILRRDLQNDPQVFAEYLLSLNSRPRSLYTKEEAIIVFKSMMADPEFKTKYSVKTQNGILSIMRDNLSDEELLDGLLGLF